MANNSAKLIGVVRSILSEGDYFLEGLMIASPSQTSLLAAVVDWAERLNRDLEDVVAVIEPCIRQSMLATLIPIQALDPDYRGSIDAAVDKHLRALGLEALDTDSRRTLRDICINVRKLQGLTSKQARQRSAGLAQVRAMPQVYSQIKARQGYRCLWCGVDLNSPHVHETLEHVTPKHIGDDASDASNWGLACASCNSGKGDTLSWAATQWAHDYFERRWVADGSVALRHRWATLMRKRRCERCAAIAKATELLVYRRVRTGLAVPANCGVICPGCRNPTDDVLTPEWAPEEASRTV